jgi:hypothetical protein
VKTLRLPWVLASAVLLAAVLPLLVVGLAGAGTNVWTHQFPHPTRWKGYKVTCAAKRCSHLSPTLLYRKNGMLYRTAFQVIRRGSGYGLAAQVQISVADGQPHGLLASIGLSGSVVSLGMGSGLGWGFGGGLGYSSHLPKIRPGQIRLSKAAYPSSKGQSPIRRGHRFKLTVNVSQVMHYNPRRSESPKVAIAILTVPYRGKPTVVFERPKP